MDDENKDSDDDDNDDDCCQQLPNPQEVMRQYSHALQCVKQPPPSVEPARAPSVARTANDAASTSHTRSRTPKVTSRAPSSSATSAPPPRSDFGMGPLDGSIRPWVTGTAPAVNTVDPSLKD